MLASQIQALQGDLLEQPVEVIVNAWNRNLIPWWLLLPQGVSGAIKKRAGYAPFRELRRHGVLPLGGAVLTSAGRLPYRGNHFWRASRHSIQQAVVAAMALVDAHGFASVAFPLIGAGTGGIGEARARQWMLEALSGIDSPAQVRLVQYQRKR